MLLPYPAGSSVISAPFPKTEHYRVVGLKLGGTIKFIPPLDRVDKNSNSRVDDKAEEGSIALCCGYGEFDSRALYLSHICYGGRIYGLTFLRSVEILRPPQYFYGYIP